MKTDSNGTLIWSKEYGNGPSTVNTNVDENPGARLGLNRGTAGDNEGDSIVQAADGDYVFLGTAYSPGLATSILVKTDTNGNVIWNSTFQRPFSSSLVATSDDGFALLGDGFAVEKTDPYGHVEEQDLRNITSNLPVQFYFSSLIETSDRGFLMLGAGENGTNMSYNNWAGNIYLIRTQPFIPSPTSTPTLAAKAPDALIPIVAVIAFLAAALTLVTYESKKRSAPA